MYQLKCLKPKNKGHTNFYECCDLTKESSFACKFTANNNVASDTVIEFSFYQNGTNFRFLFLLQIFPSELIFQSTSFKVMFRNNKEPAKCKTSVYVLAELCFQ